MNREERRKQERENQKSRSIVNYFNQQMPRLQKLLNRDIWEQILKDARFENELEKNINDFFFSLTELSNGKELIAQLLFKNKTPLIAQNGLVKNIFSDINSSIEYLSRLNNNKYKENTQQIENAITVLNYDILKLSVICESSKDIFKDKNQEYLYQAIHNMVDNMLRKTNLIQFYKANKYQQHVKQQNCFENYNKERKEMIKNDNGKNVRRS